MNAPIKFSTQKGEGGTVGYSVMTLLLLYRLLGQSCTNLKMKAVKQLLLTRQLQGVSLIPNAANRIIFNYKGITT